MTTITLPRAVVEQALEALEDLHANHGITVAGTLSALRAALAQPQETPWKPWKPLELGRGCQACGMGADGAATGYVCTRGDCPTRITCGGAA